MTTTEKLQRIRAKCVELLEIAEKRTPGKWIHWETNLGRLIGREDKERCIFQAFSPWDRRSSDTSEQNAAYITACAGPAEAAWQSTIAAIDGLLAIHDNPKANPVAMDFAFDTLNSILSAWPDELL